MGCQSYLTALPTPRHAVAWRRRRRWRRLTVLRRHLHHLHVLRRVVGLDVRVDRVAHQGLAELGARQLAPHRRLVALLSELVRPVEVTDVVDQHLRRAATTEGLNSHASPKPGYRDRILTFSTPTFKERCS